MREQFKHSLKIGEQWETVMEQWMHNYFKDSPWKVEDARHIHRDEDGDQFPDYLLWNSDTDKFCFIDAKKRRVYNRTFGFDAKFYNSYMNIAKKHNTKVYVGFHDPDFDPSSVYILDLAQPYDFVKQYNNSWGNAPSCRWYVDKLTAFKLGSVAEWPMALVLKTKDPKGSVSSNLTASAKF
jgi:hypothetical protein